MSPLDFFKRRIVGRTLRFKFRHPRGRPVSSSRIDADRLAAAIAADWIEEESGGAKRRRGRPRWWQRRTLNEEATAHAIAWLAECSPELRPDKSKVMELLRRGRTAWPGTAYN